MRILNELKGFSTGKGSIVTIGVFDGVHLGHTHLIRELTHEAKAKGVRSGVVTFRNHPRSVLTPGFKNQFLTDFDERLRLIKIVGVDFIAPITFDMDVAGYGASEFCSLLQTHLGMCGLVTGPDFALGHGREGNVTRLSALGREHGFSLKVLESFLDNDSRTIRSTTVRASLSSGDVNKVAQYLGRPFKVKGVVVKGYGRGTSIGFPTANLQVADDIALPRNSIYATWVTIGNRRLMAATSIGVRPTFGEVDRTIEAYLLDYQGDLYGQELSLEFIQWLRDEKGYDNVDELKAQISLDVVETRRVLQDPDVAINFP